MTNKKNLFLFKPQLSSVLLSCFLILSSCFSIYAQPKPVKPLTRIEFVFDASFSMFGQWQSGMKMDIAKKMLSEFLDSIKGVDNIEIALRCYGHQHGLRPERDCKDTKLEVPFAKDNTTAIKNRLKTIVPKGTTPIAYTLEQCGGDFPTATSNSVRNIIILITDGIEECDGDPCAVSLALQKKGIVLKPFIIGIGLDESYLSSFGCIGKFYDASSESTFKNILNIVVSQALNNTTVQVNLLDQAGRPTETDVDMTFYDEQTGIIRYNYMHTIGNKGVPDTIVIDPIGTYKMVVHTIPEVEKKDITLVPGKHNIIAVDAPQGYLTLKMAGTTGPTCIVRKKGEMKTLHVQQFNNTEKYILGKYDLEILTLPRIKMDAVDIAQSKTTTVEIPQSGLVSISKPNFGPGSLYVEENNKMVFVCNLNDNIKDRETIALQPGRYRVEYRPKNARESIYTIERLFKIESGNTTTVILY